MSAGQGALRVARAGKFRVAAMPSGPFHAASSLRLRLFPLLYFYTVLILLSGTCVVLGSAVGMVGMRAAGVERELPSGTNERDDLGRRLPCHRGRLSRTFACRRRIRTRRRGSCAGGKPAFPNAPPVPGRILPFSLALSAFYPPCDRETPYSLVLRSSFVVRHRFRYCSAIKTALW